MSYRVVKCLKFAVIFVRELQLNETYCPIILLQIYIQDDH
jgi:hypothetical protein